MEYENVDESAINQEACQKVKQIAEAIRKIRIKYYPNFTKISAEDKEIFDKLNNQIDKIAEKHGLNKLKVELINDIEDRYNENMPENSEEKQKNEGGSNSELAFKKYCAAKEVEVTCLKRGQIQRARQCQEEGNRLYSLLSEEEKQEAILYKRELFGTLGISISETYNRVEKYKSILKGFRTRSVQSGIRYETTNAYNQLKDGKVEQEEAKETEEIVVK